MKVGKRCVLVVLWAIYGLAAAAASPAEQKPNFIVIITDDQGWDDIGLHNPQYVNTPNLDRFIKQSTFFDNFYVTPQCAQTRAALLTGRSYPRTGTVLVNGGFDMITSDEATAGRVMSQAGYTTLQYGKWHNKQVLGYEPWNVGFDFGQMDSAVTGLVSANGSYEEFADHDGEGQRMGQLISYLTNWNTASKIAANRKAAPQQPAAAAAQPGVKPFFVYYATPAIHVTRDLSETATVKKVRLYPAAYRSKYHDNPKYQGIDNDTLDAWAMLEYFDVQLGRLVDYLQVTGLDRNTFVMIMSDNGAALMQSEDKHVRMPSGMVGNKSTIFEGGVRNFLGVQGPGVQPGVIDSTLLDVTDVLPTVAELAGIHPNEVQHKPWDGISFKNLLLPRSSNSSSSSSAGARGSSKIVTSSASSSTHQKQQSFLSNATMGGEEPDLQAWQPVIRGRSAAKKSQVERFLVLLGPQCWDPNAVLQLDNTTRLPLKPQPLLDYHEGGVRNSIHSKETPWLPANRTGFEPCLAVRYKDYKWIGATGKVYSKLQGMSMGSLNLPATPPGSNTEACLELVMSSKPGMPVFRNLANLRFVRRMDAASGTDSSNKTGLEAPTGLPTAAVAAEQTASAIKRVRIAVPATNPTVMPRHLQHKSVQQNRVGPNGMPGAAAASVHSPPLQSGLSQVWRAAAAAKLPAVEIHQARGSPTSTVTNSAARGRYNPTTRTALGRWQQQQAVTAVATAAAVQASGAEQNVSAGLPHVSQFDTVVAGAPDGLVSAWDAVRQGYLLVDGQGVFESVFSPYDTEELDKCDACQAAL